MPDQIKEIWKKILEFWNKWTKKQKIIVGSIAGATILLVVVFVVLLSRTQYVDLYTFNSTETASKAISSLKENSISAKLGADRNTVQVDEKKYVDAMVVVSNSSLGDDSFSIPDLFNASLTTTNGERLLRTHLYSQSEVKRVIEMFTGVKEATVTWMPKDTSNSILAKNQKIPVSILLLTDSNFKKSEAEAIAKLAAAAAGNEDTEDVSILDQYGNVLYDGPVKVTEEEALISDKIKIQQFFEESYRQRVEAAILMNGFTKVDVAPHLKMNFDKVEEFLKEYIPLEGENFGVITQQQIISSTGSGGVGDIPGTDSNDDSTDYFLTGANGGQSTYDMTQTTYVPTEKITNTIYDVGVISDSDSRIWVTCVRVRALTKSDLKTMGLLEDVSYEEYVLNHSKEQEVEVNEKLIEGIAAATGIPETNVVVTAYDVFEFTDDTPVKNVDWELIIQVALAIVLLGILAFVILRGMKPVEVTEAEPELSIEQLLATTKENQSLEDVEFSEESETRRMIEKFFDENPEAVAQLLRNWLNEDWM